MLLPDTQHTPKCLNLRQKGERKRQASIPQCPIPRPGKQSGRAKKNAASLAQNRKRLYLCTANEAGQGHSSAGLERFSHIEEVIGSNPIVPTSTAEPKRTHHQGAPAFSFHPLSPARRSTEIGNSQRDNWKLAARKLGIRNADGEQQEEGFFGTSCMSPNQRRSCP